MSVYSQQKPAFGTNLRVPRSARPAMETVQTLETHLGLAAFHATVDRPCFRHRCPEHAEFAGTLPKILASARARHG